MEQSRIRVGKDNGFSMSLAGHLQTSIEQGQWGLPCQSPYEASVLRGASHSGMPAKQSSQGSRSLDRFNSPDFIELINAEDAQAFGELTRVLVPLLTDYIYDIFAHNQHALSNGDAEDVAQETMFRVSRAVRSGGFKHRSEYKSTSDEKSAAEFTTWIFKIAYNLACVRYKQLKRRNEVQFSNLGSNIGGSLSSNTKKRNRADSNELGEDVGISWSDPVKKLHVEQVLQHLKEEYRDVLVRVCIDGLAPEDVAELEGVRVNTIHQRLARARKQFRQAYAKL